jgi:DNA-binding GntR family transcriptional regulator
MHELAAREAVPGLSAGQLDAMRAANERFAAAIEAGDAEGALEADDQFHGVLIDGAANAALTAVLDLYTPVLRRAEVLRFLSVDRFSSAERHAQLIELCARGDADAAAALAFHTWHSLPLGDAVTPDEA